MISIDIKVVGLDEEIKGEIGKINNQIPNALNYVGAEMIVSLKRHIDQDFYNKYSPVAYPRRYTKGLLNPENIDVSRKGKKLIFTYTPDGSPSPKHKESLNWSDDLARYLKSKGVSGETPIFSPTRKGDDLIVWGQKEHKLGATKIPARPFWNQFVEEQKNGKIMENFIAGMQPKYEIITEGTEKDIQFGADESMLDWGTYQQSINTEGK